MMVKDIFNGVYWVKKADRGAINKLTADSSNDYEIMLIDKENMATMAYYLIPQELGRMFLTISEAKQYCSNHGYNLLLKEI